MDLKLIQMETGEEVPWDGKACSMYIYMNEYASAYLGVCTHAHPPPPHPHTKTHKTHQKQSFGELAVRGNWVVSRYYKQEGDASSSMMHIDADGREWFLTGDVATIDADGFVKITDRSKGKG